MEKLSVRKKLAIIRLYFSGLSYRDIAVKAGVSTGAVANVIADLKAGNYPEAADLTEQVDMLRELGAEVKKSRLTVGEALTGITVINCLRELGVEAGDIQQCVSLCKTLTPGDIETRVFAKAAMKYQEVLQRTGLGVEELENKVRSLEEASHRLGPMAKKAHDLKKEIADLEMRNRQLADEVAGLEERRQILVDTVKEREQREASLSTRIAQLEDKLESQELRLAGARKDLKALAGVGMSLDELSGFIQRLKGVAHRHGIDPKALYGRLLTELEQLDRGLDVETIVQTKQQELNKVEAAIAKAREESVTLDHRVQQLRQELSTLKAQITDEKESLSQELKSMIIVVHDSMAGLKRGLGKGIQEGLDEVNRLKEEAIELGKELGQIDVTIKSNAWLEGVLSLLKGEDKATASEIRVIALILLKSVLAWLERNRYSEIMAYSLTTTIKILVSEFERWKPNANSAESSKIFSAS
jgi:predicted  nucleic acid-binding Zn-ribbon protein